MIIDMAISPNHFAVEVGKGFDPDPHDSVFASLFRQYERVVFESLITSFGLDMFIKDRRGGDVDTVHNVRAGEEFRNAAHQEAYDQRGAYDPDTYHTDSAYIASKRMHNQQQAEGTLIDYATGERIGLNAPSDQDHVISAKEVHDDPGRVLSGKSGVALANTSENLKATNPRTNRTKRALTMDEFLERYGDEYTEEQKERLRQADREARESYDRSINTAYYISPGFWADAGIAAAKVGIQMGLRQVLGLVMTEIWFAVREKLSSVPESLEAKLIAIAEGIEEGLQRAKKMYRGCWRNWRKEQSRVCFHRFSPL